MAIPVLVVTPNPGFGELIGQVLLETNHYSVSLALDADQAIAHTLEHKPVLCIYDCNLQTPPPAFTIDKMREAVADLLLVVLPPEKGENGSSNLAAQGTLSRPFYLPDLISTVQLVMEATDKDAIRKVPTEPLSDFRKAPIEMSEDTTPAPEWLKNVNLAAQHLTRLSLETAAQASLITRAENNWAYAGELPQSAVDEITRTVTHYFGDGGSGDLARFIRLETMDSEYMLYATGLGGDFVLALVFDAETPFSKIRTQANSLAASLAATPPADILEDTQSSPVEAEAEIEQELDENAKPQPLWDSIPPPIPTDWLPEEKTVSRVERMLDDLINEDFSPAVSPMENPFTRKEAKPERVEKRQVEVAMQAETDEKPELEQTVVSSLRTLPEHLADTMVSESTLEATNAETAEFSAETMVSRSAQPEIELPPMAVEPATPAMYNLVYACVLVPRMPHHYLTGDLSNNLSEWLTQLALAFGWRLEQLSIRPEYIQWLINVPPKTSPGYLMRIMRQHLSRRIFKEFPRLAEDNPSGDFWAPGYLIISSNQAPPAKLIADFINETRNRQGAGGKF